ATLCATAASFVPVRGARLLKYGHAEGRAGPGPAHQKDGAAVYRAAPRRGQQSGLDLGRCALAATIGRGLLWRGSACDLPGSSYAAGLQDSHIAKDSQTCPRHDISWPPWGWPPC